MTDTPMTPLQARQAEVAQYETNIAMYTAIIATLPTEWPTSLLDYRNAADKHAAIASVDDMEDVNLLSQLWYADQCYAAIRSETLEMNKAKAILTVLQSMA
jgi:hypothetical protein